MEPLASRMRPKSLDEFYGQEHLLGPGKPLFAAFQSKRLHAMILWGPPGTGKTTFANLLANHIDTLFISLSAVLVGIKEIRAALEEGASRVKAGLPAPILFVDEVHRFNKGQQDAFLPFVERGEVLFIGATTENPSFELNNALLSRARVYVFKNLSVECIVVLLKRALADCEKGLGNLSLKIQEEFLEEIARSADGDARQALNWLEMISHLADENHVISREALHHVLGQKMMRFDKSGDFFYDHISVLHKCVRGSQPNAALYWLARMIVGGCDPLYIARRLIRMATEDIGNADPRALTIALNAWDIQERLGSPEGELALAQAIIYLSCAAKSNAAYLAWNKAQSDASASSNLEIPWRFRNAPTSLLKTQGAGKNYRYAHDEPYAYAAGENYFPDGFPPKTYYQPTEFGLEKKIQEKLAFLKQLDMDYLVRE